MFKIQFKIVHLSRKSVIILLFCFSTPVFSETGFPEIVHRLYRFFKDMFYLYNSIQFIIKYIYKYYSFIVLMFCGFFNRTNFLQGDNPRVTIILRSSCMIGCIVRVHSMFIRPETFHRKKIVFQCQSNEAVNPWIQEHMCCFLFVFFGEGMGGWRGGVLLYYCCLLVKHAINITGVSRYSF